MWVKTEIIPGDAEIIYLPASLASPYQSLTRIIFGSLSTNAEIRYSSEPELADDNTFERPTRVRLSEKLKEKLLIPDSLVYRLKIQGTNVIIGPVIGLLLGIHTHRYIPKHMKKYSDRFGIYHKVGGLIYAFSPKTVNWEKRTAYGLYYNIAASKWEYGHFPLPEVIYRRDFHFNGKTIQKLIKLTKGRLFNSYRFSKMELYDIARRDSNLCKYLPPTEMSLNAHQVKKFIDQYGKAILKPIDLSRGRGICVIEKNENSYKVTDYRDKNPNVCELADTQALENFLSKNQDFFSKYLVQKYLPLARINHSLFDIRVVMHKTKEKDWECSGIECRVSNGKSHLTNISKGGYALLLEDALKKAFPTNCDYKELSRQIHELCILFCQQMDRTGNHFAEWGMDIAIDVHKNLWLIEANVFPSFKGFKSMDYETYLSIRYKPLLYALSLTEFGDENE